MELATRWDYSDAAHAHGIPESFRSDASTHSLLGASKVAADAMAQEYGRYFGMPTCCLRSGCVTGPSHSGVELRGFLSYLVKCNLAGRHYMVFGYKGKQVCDVVHAADVSRFIAAPWIAAVDNIGGGKANSCSVLEAFAIAADRCGWTTEWSYDDNAREGDHICSDSDPHRIEADYPGWRPEISLGETFDQLVESRERRRVEKSTAKAGSPA